MTSLGRRLAMPDPARAVDDLREAFMNAELFASIYQETAKGQTLDKGALANNAVLNYGVGVVSREPFLRSFVASSVVAQLAEELPDGKLRLLQPGSLEDQTGEEQRSAQPRTKDSNVRTDAVGNPVVAQEWIVLGGRIRFLVSLDRPLPIPAYGLLEDVAKAVQSLADALGPPDD